MIFAFDAQVSSATRARSDEAWLGPRCWAILTPSTKLGRSGATAATSRYSSMAEVSVLTTGRPAARYSFSFRGLQERIWALSRYGRSDAPQC